MKRIVKWWTLRRFHALRIWVWSVQIPVALATGLKTSVPYVVFLSLAALVEGATAAWMGSRSEDSSGS